MSNTLNLPGPFDTHADAYKDWLHINLFDHASGTVGLLNVSLHGPPTDPRSRAVGTVLFHVPDLGWRGNTEIARMADTAVGPAFIGLRHVALAVDEHAQTLVASAQFADEEVAVKLDGSYATTPTEVEHRLPLGAGWISWFAVPRVSVGGHVSVGSHTLDLHTASAYHDHNWGRWRWGDDFGWQWGVFSARASGPTFLVSRTTDRSHARLGSPLFTMDSATRRRFGGASIEYRYDGQWRGSLRRLPGAQAALRGDRSHPALPARVLVVADDGRDRVVVRFDTRAAAQIIAPDPLAPGTSFIHELVGEFTYQSCIDGRLEAGGGLAVVEHVD